MLGSEPVVEALGYPLHVECLGDSPRGIVDGDLLLFFKREAQAVEPLRQSLGALPLAVDEMSVARLLAQLALRPLPAERAAVLGREDDEVFVRVLGDLPFDLLPRGVVGQASARDALIGHEATLLRDGFEGERPAVHGDSRVGAAVVPAELFYEQPAKVERIQQSPDDGSVQWWQWFHVLPSSPRRLPSPSNR